MERTYSYLLTASRDNAPSGVEVTLRSAASRGLRERDRPETPGVTDLILSDLRTKEEEMIPPGDDGARPLGVRDHVGLRTG
jgi:hypothetical protein